MHNRLDMLRLFCVAAESRSFKEAAARLGISPQAVTRAVQALEDQLGEVLFHRNTRGSQITAFGEAFALRARDRLGALEALFPPRAGRAADEMVGRVRLTAPRLLGPGVLAPALAALSAHHPGLQVDLRLSDAVADVVDEGIDVGVRVGFMRDSRFVAKAVGQVSFHVVAAPALLARVGAPAGVADLARMPVTVTLDANSGRPWPWFFSDGRQWMPPQPAFQTDDSLSEFDAVVAGAGFGQVVGLLARPALADGRLVDVLPAERPDPWTLFVYRTVRHPVPARVRRVFDLLVHCLGEPAAAAGGFTSLPPQNRSGDGAPS